VGVIIIGAAHVHPSSLMAPLLMPQLWDDSNIEPLRKIEIDGIGSLTNPVVAAG
jgi:hypothetical protein